MDDDTTAVEVAEFVLDRTRNPAVLRGGDVIVYNYNNQLLHASVLSEWALDAEPGIYHYPFQISGVWTFIESMLPNPIRDSDILAYRKRNDEYVAYENWRATLDSPDEEFEDQQTVSSKQDELYWAFREVADV